MTCVQGINGLFESLGSSAEPCSGTWKAIDSSTAAEHARLIPFGLKANGVQAVSEESNTMTFKAAATSVYTEDGVLTVAFADSVSVDPENYLILQQEVPRAEDNKEDDYYFEFNDRSMSGEGGFNRAYLDHGGLVIVLAEALAKKYAFSSIRICGVQSTCDVGVLRESLHSVFDNTGCLFED